MTLQKNSFYNINHLMKLSPNLKSSTKVDNLGKFMINSVSYYYYYYYFNMKYFFNFFFLLYFLI